MLTCITLPVIDFTTKTILDRLVRYSAVLIVWWWEGGGLLINKS